MKRETSGQRKTKRGGGHRLTGSQDHGHSEVWGEIKRKQISKCKKTPERIRQGETLCRKTAR